ncbi:hypothetical protein Mgra_00006682 [Meloidogyne graminicola]|uniref:PH domain-containing protein n=1 Tax=Meloidogyne graminicola TaxID=189291 RepID=A0A8S9ZLE2_9BILA|nr:hypothetical protein Mgra_00006682 [Meloidogyne graminicola]
MKKKLIFLRFLIFNFNLILKSIYNEFLNETNNQFYEQKQEEEVDWLEFKKMVQKTPSGLLGIFTIIDLINKKSISSNLNNLLLTEEGINGNIIWIKLKELNNNFIIRPILILQIFINLILILIEILGICSESSSVFRRFGSLKCPRFFRLVLQCERPFYQLFEILIELFCKTWNDMNAKLEEINKVYNVVQDQLERSLLENPNSLEFLEKELLKKKFCYFNIQKIWKCEQLEQEELELNNENILPLKIHLRPEIENLAIHRRIVLLKKGMIFKRILPLKTSKENSMISLSSSVSVHSSPVSSTLLNSPQQQQYWFWCLDENEKFLYFCDCNLNSGKQTKHEMEKKVLISDIKNILTGQELISHLNQQPGSGKLYKKSQNILRCGILIECYSSVEFLLCAQNEQEFIVWYEAIICLCWPQKSLKNNKNIQKEVFILF